MAARDRRIVRNRDAGAGHRACMHPTPDPERAARYRLPWPPRPVVVAAVAAVLGALAPQAWGVLGLALAGSPLVVAALLRRRVDAWCLALPAGLAAYAPTAAAPVAPPAGPVVVHGEVSSRLVVDDLRGTARCVVARAHARVLCVFARDTRLHPGDNVRALGRLTPRDGRDGTCAVVDVPAGGVLAIEHARSLIGAAEGLRLALHDGLVRAVPGRAGRLLAQLVLGHGGDIDLDIADAHRATGLSHLLAVSGAHVSLLAAMLSALVGRRGRARPSWSVLVAVAVYGTITGLDPPVLRALVAFTLLLAASRAGRHLPPIAALAVPGVLTAILQPEDATSASFALSYAAVAGLVLTPPPRRPLSLTRAFTYALSASAWATLATAPFTLHLFGQVAPWTILATPVLGPVVALMLAAGLLLATLGALDVAAPWLALPLRLLAEGYIGCVDALSRLPGAPVLAVCQPPLLLLSCSGLVALVVLVARPDRVGVAGVCLSFALAYFVPWPPAGPAMLALYDVGHGQACLLRLPGGEQVAVDCGSQGNPRRAALTLGRGLAARRRIDLLVLTHQDADHTGGTLSLLRRTRVEAAAMPAESSDGALARALRRAGVRVLGVRAGEAMEPLAGLRLARPGGVASSLSNDTGLWARCDLGSFSVLLCGDAEEAGVEAWLASPYRAPADVLVLPHHGRRHGAITPLLSAVRPRLALVSGGDASQAAPSAKVAAALGVRVLETAQVGDIVVRATAPPRIVLNQPEPLLVGPK